MSSSCNSVQEEIAWGRALAADAHAHAAACADCAALARRMAALDAVFGGVDGGEVPAGFAERVMARLERPVSVAAPTSGWTAPLLRLMDWRGVQLALAYGGVLFSLTNLLRFVLSTLVPAVSLGAGR
jgi:hypothetical protein